MDSARNSDWKKYQRYALEVDPKQNDKAKEINLCDFSRPHMRAFHCAWWSFFIAFFNWFAIVPLIPHIRKDLGISEEDVWTSNVASVGGTILIRIILGPLCDKFGARVLFTIVLCTTAIPTACIGLIQTPLDLAVVRLFIGLAGGTFVMCEYWSSVMFANEIVGTANALVAGWGNLGAGVTQLVIGTGLLPLLRVINGGDSEMAWRTVCILPALTAFFSGVVVYFISDDAPKGNYSELKRFGAMRNVSASRSFSAGFWDWNTWILSIQYACCFGVELTMNSAASLYFKNEFGQSHESAAAIASLFGWMNLFARGLGGFTSDLADFKFGLQGRLLVQTVFIAMEGILVFIFASMDSLFGSIAVLVFFSLFVQAAEGSTYGVVPFVNPSTTGTISGIVGAGGNVGAVCFSIAFRNLDYSNAFFIMGGCTLASSALSCFIRINNYSQVVDDNEHIQDDEDHIGSNRRGCDA